MRVNAVVSALPEPATVALADRVRQMRSAGIEVIGLQTGDPDFATPRAIIDVAYRAMESGQTHYAESRGSMELRQAIGRKLMSYNKVEYNAEREVLVTCGGIHAYYCGLLAILQQNSEILIPDPAWMTHANMVHLVGGRAVRVPALAENGFWPTLPEWEKALTSKTIALVINSPNNPTGAVADQAYLERLNDFASAHDLYVISDEVYENIVFTGRQHSSFAALKEAKCRTLLVNSLSKTYAMTGWRVGYLAAPAQIIDSALKAAQHTITNLAPFIQSAAAFALTDPSAQEAARHMTAAYARRRESVLRQWKEARDTRIRLVDPEGAFYFFVDIRALGLSSVSAADRLLEEVSVALVPGSAFGGCGEGYLRMTIAAADADIDIGFQRVLAWANSLS